LCEGKNIIVKITRTETRTGIKGKVMVYVMGK